MGAMYMVMKYRPWGELAKSTFLYDYNEEELQKLAEEIKFLARQSKHVFVLFNNNSGGHAAKNAKRMQQILDLEFDGLAPKQLGLFEE